MPRRLAALVLTTISIGFAPASADATLVAQGPVTATVKSGGVTRTCSAVTGLEFHNTGSTFLLTEATPAGQQSGTPPVCLPVAIGPYANTPTVKQCTPNGGIIIPGSTLTVQGNTYTIRSSYTTCSGQSGNDTIVMTVSATKVTYKHDAVQGTSEIHVVGTLNRVA